MLNMKTLPIVLALAITATGCSRGGTSAAHATPEPVVAAPAAAAPARTSAAESNAANSAGDIPDSQAFVRYAGPSYSVLVPEGWARSQYGEGVLFTSNLNAEKVTVGGAAGTSGTTRTRTVTIGGAPVVVYRFATQSAPNAVTGKSVRLDNEVYVFRKNGRVAMLTLSAPAGADNVDQYKKISESFRWR